MKRKARLFLYAVLLTTILVIALIVVSLLSAVAGLLGTLHPYAAPLFLLFSSGILLFALYTGVNLFSVPKRPELPKDEKSKGMAPYFAYLGGRLPVHPGHPEQLKKEREQRWVSTNLKFLEIDSLNITKQIATKNFFIGAFAQNTSYGTTASLWNNIKVIWNIYTIHNRDQHLLEFVMLVRSVYACLPLSDFKKEEITTHIQPIIQSSFSNTLSSLLPAGNLLTPFFLNLFLAGSTNAYLTCLVGIIATHQAEATTEEDKREIIQQSNFEASFMLKEIVRECNPILSVTISKAVKKAGIESLDNVQPPSAGSGMAQDIVSHLASSLKQMLKDG